MSFLDIQAALDSRLATLPDSPPVAWENVKYKPIQGVTYLRPTNLPSATFAVGMANTDSTRLVGLYQVDVFAPTEGGPGESLGVIDAIADIFPRGLIMTQGDAKIVVGVPTIDASETSGAWHIARILIPYTNLS